MLKYKLQLALLIIQLTLLIKFSIDFYSSYISVMLVIQVSLGFLICQSIPEF
jgi:hypothetical protein